MLKSDLLLYKQRPQYPQGLTLTGGAPAASLLLGALTFVAGSVGTTAVVFWSALPWLPVVAGGGGTVTLVSTPPGMPSINPHIFPVSLKYRAVSP